MGKELPKSTLILGIIVLILLVIIFQNRQATLSYEFQPQSECAQGLQKIGGKCCLDQDSNYRCDEDEKIDSSTVEVSFESTKFNFQLYDWRKGWTPGSGGYPSTQKGHISITNKAGIPIRASIDCTWNYRAGDFYCSRSGKDYVDIKPGTTQVLEFNIGIWEEGARPGDSAELVVPILVEYKPFMEKIVTATVASSCEDNCCKSGVFHVNDCDR